MPTTWTSDEERANFGEAIEISATNATEEQRAAAAPKKFGKPIVVQIAGVDHVLQKDERVYDALVMVKLTKDDRLSLACALTQRASDNARRREEAKAKYKAVKAECDSDDAHIATQWPFVNAGEMPKTLTVVDRRDDDRGEIVTLRLDTGEPCEVWDEDVRTSLPASRAMNWSERQIGIPVTDTPLFEPPAVKRRAKKSVSEDES